MTNLIEIIRHDKSRVIEFIIGVIAMLSSLYLMSPLYIASETSAVAQETTTLGIKLYGVIYFIGAVVLLIGVIKDNTRCRRIGNAILFITSWYILTIVWITNGLRPISWVGTFTVTMILTYLFVVEKE